MEVGALGIKLIKRWEGIRLTSYQDEAGLWTIGIGHRTRVNYPYSITSLEAEALLEEDLKKVSAALSAMLLTDEIEQHEFDALGSWVFNVGEYAAKKSTLIRMLNLGEPRIEIASQFLRWNKLTLPNGEKVKSRGLTRRRESERQLFLTGVLKFF